MSKSDYEKQAALVVRVLPEIEKEPCFAIKGGVESLQIRSAKRST